MAVNLEDADRAKRFYGLALELEPNAVPLRKEVVRSYRRLGLEDEAVAVGRGATERNPDDALAWTVRADAERRAGLQEDARRSYTRVLELDPGNERAKQVLARMDG